MTGGSNEIYAKTGNTACNSVTWTAQMVMFLLVCGS